MKICVIPIDNRPVCYNLIKDIADIDGDIELFLPDREFLGGLDKIADIDKIFGWLKSLPEMDYIILSLDTLAYGGLIPSRRSEDSFETIRARIETLKGILVKKGAKILAFSSIMRISNNNFNQEEKTYWNKYGKLIFDYSYFLHKDGKADCINIPSEVLEDYLSTRSRNFEVNKIYLEWQKQGLFDTLIFSKDDCAEYGFNVQEAKELERLGGFCKTGADEIPLTLFARAIEGKMKVCVEFLEPEFKNLVSKYEDVSIEKSVLGQLELAKIKIVDKEDADLVLVVNNFRTTQGEIVMNVDTEMFEGEFNPPKKPFMIADVRFANGADNNFVKSLFKTIYDERFYGYSAWNTSANSLGSLICGAKVKFLAKKYSEKSFKKLQSIRFLDDWAYQANIRQILKKPEKPNMVNFEKEIKMFLHTNFVAEYSFPWDRLFEIEVNLN